MVLQKNEGEVRTRRPREGVASPSSDFMLKVSPKINGSNHFLLGTEEIPPGAVIPKQIQTGRAHVLLADEEYDAEPGALVFIPAGTWISLKNTSKENISLMFVWNEPGFEDMMRCASVPKGEVPQPISRKQVQECYEHGDGELDLVQPSADRKP